MNYDLQGMKLVILPVVDSNAKTALGLITLVTFEK
tara:strand:+ start:984 stop:1088 length:105 start_codon:yes stop_codon:yes gene_type:complete